MIVGFPSWGCLLNTTWRNVSSPAASTPPRFQQIHVAWPRYVCYCEKNDGELSDSTASLRAAIPEIEASITEAENLKAQLDQELAAHKKARFFVFGRFFPTFLCY